MYRFIILILNWIILTFGVLPRFSCSLKSSHLRKQSPPPGFTDWLQERNLSYLPCEGVQGRSDLFYGYPCLTPFVPSWKGCSRLYVLSAQVCELPPVKLTSTHKGWYPVPLGLMEHEPEGGAVWDKMYAAWGVPVSQLGSHRQGDPGACGWTSWLSLQRS